MNLYKLTRKCFWTQDYVLEESQVTSKQLNDLVLLGIARQYAIISMQDLLDFLPYCDTDEKRILALDIMLRLPDSNALVAQLFQRASEEWHDPDLILLAKKLEASAKC